MKESEKIIDIEKVIQEKNPKLLKMLPRFVLNYIKRILHEDDINEFISKHKNDSPLDFSRAVMEKFNLQLEHEGLENIPTDGGAIIAMNHPWGGMDAMALIAVAYDKRPDLKFIVNDILMHLENLNSIFVGVSKFNKNGKNSLQTVEETFAGDDLLCIFPAGLVSRKVKGKVVDLEWKKTFVTRAIKYDKTIIPTYIDGRLSNFFYNFSNIRKKLGIKANIEMFFLVNELYKQRNKKIIIKFGRPIQASTLDNSKTHAQWAKIIKDRVYQLKD